METSDILGIIAAVLFTALLLGCVYFTIHKQHNVAQDFCSDGLVMGSGIINYCQGAPFVCTQEGTCYYVSKSVENCWEEMSGKTLITRCE